jgi:predicted RND superfamily exporter protein
VTQRLSSAGTVHDVYGVANAPLLVPDVGGFAVRRLVENGAPASDLDELARRALEDPLWLDTLVSADGRVGVIIVQPTTTTNDVHVALVAELERALEEHEKAGFRFHLLGDAVENVIPGRKLAQSSARLVPITIFIIAAVLYGLSHSLPLVAVSVATMALALLWTFGLLAWLDWPQDGILEVLAPLILVIGVCDAIHFLARYASLADSRHDEPSPEQRAQLLDEVAREIAAPCLLTSLTTAIAFASFVTSELGTFVRFGTAAAFGVVACLLLTFSLLPSIAHFLPLNARNRRHVSDAWKNSLLAVARTVERRAWPVLVSSLILFIFCGVGWAAYLRVDTDWLESWGEQSEIVRSIRFAEAHLNQSTALEAKISLPEGTALEDSDSLLRIREFSSFLSSLDGFTRVTSVVDYIERLNRVLHDNDPRYQRVADSGDANAQILELVNFEDPGILAAWINLDRSAARISARSAEQSYATSVGNLGEIRRWTAENLPAGWSTTLTGEYTITVDWIRDVQGTQLRSFPAAFALVFLMVWAFLRSARLAALAMVPTLLPVVVVLGAMGWVGMSLDVGRAMIAAVIIGIAVDDSIHLLSHYKRCRNQGDGARRAIERAVLHTGRAVVTTSVALSLGFLTLMASAWQTISSFGFFVSLAIAGALIATLSVLPALIVVFAKDSSLPRTRP